ncbi:MAG: proline dehydrogenase family protein [Caldilineaceae bacterium]|nr:proline dehydrogenase family protein [Caldilineaceae bacterium]MBP8110167.1 proline dehydrogenase family protein [Caldilineaceae bacterium]MBP8125300.1 proline dehydrogenase family protein [Caldilineaceae bacterium]MBP9072115.1 proline dehydrogenase family protein [Caldilineaceae bacterium]
MLRSLLIYLSKAAWARRIVTGWGVARAVALRFVAGETPDDAIRAVEELNAAGIFATLDHLGEHTTSPAEAAHSTADVLHMLDLIQSTGVQSNVSVKLTQLGLNLDTDLCRNNMAAILDRAAQNDVMVRIDMEDTPFTDRTLQIYYELRAGGFANVGIVIQSYLYRSEADVAALMAKGARVRMVKGAYLEPENLAWPQKRDVDANFDKLTAMLIDAALAAGSPPSTPDGKSPAIPAIASQDEARITLACDYAQKVGLPKSALEFQMLYGIRRDLQERLVREGYPVRVYVPYGSEWYPYFMRRLAERPANIWFFVSNFFKK